jgi:CheY-like chemotaxis protein
MELYDNVRYYHRIPGLFIPKNDKVIKYEQTHSDINRFIDTVPGLTETMEDNFLNIGKRRNHFINDMELVISLLAKVYAKGMESEAEKILQCGRDDNRLAMAGKLLKPFITDLLSLSVSMQRAQGLGAEKISEAVSEIEVHAEQARNILAVCHLFEDGEYEKAKIMLQNLAEQKQDEAACLRLLTLIASNKYDEAITAVIALRDRHIKAINQLAGTDFSKIILTVDDMPEILKFVKNALRDHYKVIAAPGAKTALKVLETQKPDLFILDIDMPEMDGYELAARIRNTAQHEKTPLIFLTGNSTREHIAKAMLVKCDDFIVKPASHEYLLTKAGKFLNAGGG